MTDKTSLQSPCPIILAILLYTIHIGACVLSQNHIHLYGHIFSICGFIYPITFILLVALVELYGINWGYRLIWAIAIGYSVMIMMIFVLLNINTTTIFIIIHYFKIFLEELMLMLLMSGIAFLFSSLLTVWLMARLKQKLGDNQLLLRTILALSVFVIVDTLIFSPIFFIDSSSISAATVTVLLYMLLKLLFQFILLPVFYYGVRFAKRSLTPILDKKNLTD